MNQTTSILLCVLILALGPVTANATDDPTPEPQPVVTTTSQTPDINWDEEDESHHTQALQQKLNELKQMPPGPEARRTAIDAIILATAADDSAIMNELKLRMLVDYPDSSEAAFVLTLFKDSAALREFLNKQVLNEITTKDQAITATKVIRVAFQKHKASILEDQACALRIARVAFMAGDRRTCNQGRVVLKDIPLKVAVVACEESVSPADRFQLLQTTIAKPEYQNLVIEINGFQKALFQMMPIEDQQKPEIRRILARNQLMSGELESALNHFEFLADSINDPQLIFQHGLCLARLRRIDEARTILQKLTDQHPKSEWSTSASTLLNHMQDLDQKLEENADLIYSAITAYRDLDIEIGQTEIRFSNQSGAFMKFEFGIDLPRHFYEVLAWRNDELWVAMKCHGQESTVYMKNEPTILHMPKVPLMLTATLNDCSIDENGQFHGSTQFGSGKSLAELQQTIREVLHNDDLCSKSAIKRLLRGLIRSGQFPVEVLSDENGKTCRFIHPNIDESKPYLTKFCFDTDHLIVYASTDYRDTLCEIPHFVLGSKTDHKLKPGVWPAIPTKTLPENDASTLLRLAALLTQFIAPTPTPPETASKPIFFAEPR